MNPSRKSTRKIIVPAGQQPGRPRTERLNAAPPPPPPKNNQPLIIGGAVAGLVLIVGLAVAVSGGKEAPKPKTLTKKPAASATPKPVDVSGLIREGERQCADGYRI